MPNKLFLAGFTALCCCFISFSQNKDKSIQDSIPSALVVKDTIVKSKTIDPLRPAKAAFLSAVFPGLGQAYNKKYWKIPIVYGALGTGMYFYLTNDKEYRRYRDAFRRRLAGFQDDEFYFDSSGNQLSTPRVSDDGLIRAQQLFRRNKEVSLLVTIGLYALNIIDANVDAHLLQYNVDENLTLAPHYELNDIDNGSTVGLSLNWKF
ncbi:DUF5683 domain-containing protein [Hyunsoonleella pacifica]|uniref:DUF5683 domain-containing protein n=1 Tax=Hyunsoonleella pacifica TaxID=1080224 RepID=A0A4Q9FS18_9FLAO|nr:DUF5683 domain-containing protein [Hyunsoonleella pacifica]TBN18596.1 hypothetical protein EYD46_00585 [Hyunsoonleella pacifica]GGD03084.1 hypothetical protein GCM10011368_01170 [Hyunsoonleella pacifica]